MKNRKRYKRSHKKYYSHDYKRKNVYSIKKNAPKAHSKLFLQNYVLWMNEHIKNYFQVEYPNEIIPIMTKQQNTTKDDDDNLSVISNDNTTNITSSSSTSSSSSSSSSGIDSTISSIHDLNIKYEQNNNLYNSSNCFLYKHKPSNNEFIIYIIPVNPEQLKAMIHILIKNDHKAIIINDFIFDATNVYEKLICPLLKRIQMLPIYQYIEKTYYETYNKHEHFHDQCQHLIKIILPDSSYKLTRTYKLNSNTTIISSIKNYQDYQNNPKKIINTAYILHNLYLDYNTNQVKNMQSLIEYLHRICCYKLLHSISLSKKMIGFIAYYDPTYISCKLIYQFPKHILLLCFSF